MVSAQSAIGLGLLLIAVLGTPMSYSQQAKPSETENRSVDELTKGSKNIDQLVDHPIDKMQHALKLSMETFGFEIKKERPDYLEGTRSRRIGLMLGSGGEKVTVKLSSDSSKTRVKVETGKGFVGRLGKKNWSTPIFNEAMKILGGS